MNDIYLILSGYKKTTRQVLLNIFIFSSISILILLFIFGIVSILPLLFTVSFYCAETWWKSREIIAYTDQGIKKGEKLYKWNEIERYTTWEFIKFPLFPLKFKGITIYLKDGEVFNFYSHAQGFEHLLTRLKTLSFPEPKEPIWYSYPSTLVRDLRYIVALIYSILFIVIFLFWWLIIVILIGIIYFIIKKVIQKKLKKGKEDKKIEIKEGIIYNPYIPIIITIILFGIIYYIFQDPYILFGIEIVPLLLIVWFPLNLSPLTIISDALFVGKFKAYPLRHLKVMRTISKFFIIKPLYLYFENGEIYILPFLEEFEKFKKNLEETWSKVQRKYQRKKMTKEEAEVRSPEEEARKLKIFSQDTISLSLSLNAMLMFFITSIFHLIILFLLYWIIYYTILGKIYPLGLFLKEIFPIILISYIIFIVFNLLPKVSDCFKRYTLKKDGIYIGNKPIKWEKIDTIVTYKNEFNKKRIALIDDEGNILITLKQEMPNLEFVYQKIKENLKEIKKRDIINNEMSKILQEKVKNIERFKKNLIIFIILLIFPFIIWNIYNKKSNILNPTNRYRSVTGEPTYLLSFLFGKKLVIIPYQDIKGNIWHAICINKNLKKDITYKDYNIYYLPNDPLYIYIDGALKEPILNFAEYLEEKNIIKIKTLDEYWNILVKIGIFIWLISILIVGYILIFKSRLKFNLFLQKKELFQNIHIPILLIIKNISLLLMHLVIILILLLIFLSIVFPNLIFIKILIPIYISPLNIFLTFLIPILLSFYIPYFLGIIIPNTLYGFKKWEITDIGIKDKKNQILKWEDIIDISEFEIEIPLFFYRKKRKIAVITSSNKIISLENDLLNFEEIIEYIKTQVKVKKKNQKKAKRYIKKRLSFLRLFNALTSILIIVSLWIILPTIINYQNNIYKNGEISVGNAKKFFYKIYILSYKDNFNRKWYSIIWKSDDKNKDNKVYIVYNKKYPAFWTTIYSKDFFSLKELIIEKNFSFIKNFINNNSKILQKIFNYFIISLLLLYLIPLIWYLFGTLLGILPIEINNKSK